MGMFDHVVCRVQLPDGWEPPADDGFQSKDFDCFLATYVITEGGLLMRHGGWLEENEAGESPPPTIVEFHGTFRFYGCEPAPPGKIGAWHEYEAKFTDGRLVTITQVPESR